MYRVPEPRFRENLGIAKPHERRERAAQAMEAAQAPTLGRLGWCNDMARDYICVLAHNGQLT